MICIRLALIVFLLFIPIVFADCAEDKTACYEECNKACNEKKYSYCRTYEYSGCALDVFCDCNKCEFYDSKWCPIEGYMGCAEGPIKKYETCVLACQSEREAGNDVSTCWNDCNDVLINGLIPCKDKQCTNSCISQGYKDGKWAPYTQSGYDSCDCAGESAPELDVMESSQPQPFPETIKPSAPAKDSWDFCSAEKSLSDSIKYWFTSEENKGRKGKVGFVKAVKDKSGIDLYRNGKYCRVGVHTPLFPGDRFRTGPNSKMKVVLLNTDGTQDIIEMRSNSLFEVEGSRYEDYDDSIRIVKAFGSMVATIKRRIQGKKPNFYVKTPYIVLGIRGTEFFFSYDNATHEMLLMVKEGEVEVTGSTTVIVKAGEQVKAENGVFGPIEELDYKWDTDADWDEAAGLSIYTKVLFILAVAGLGFFVYKKFRK